MIDYTIYETGELMLALLESWSAETSFEPERWKPGRPDIGQCDVTALVVQDLIGGRLLRCALPDGESHYWNMIAPSWREIDLTEGQFDYSIAWYRERGWTVVEREALLSNVDTARRYELLYGRVMKSLGL